MISNELKQDCEYKSFMKDCKNPAIGPKYIKDKYQGYFDTFFV